MYDCAYAPCCPDFDVHHCDEPCIVENGLCVYDIPPEYDILPRGDTPCEQWDAYDCSFGNPCVLTSRGCEDEGRATYLILTPPPTYLIMTPPMCLFVVLALLVSCCCWPHAEQDSQGGSTVNAMASAAGLERK